MFENFEEHSETERLSGLVTLGQRGRLVTVGQKG